MPLEVRTDFSDEIEAALRGSTEIAKADYIRWTRQGDLASRARAYLLSGTHWSRIHPQPEVAEHCDFMSRYLLECLLTDPPTDGYIHSGFEAAHEIAAWLKHLAARGNANAIIIDVVNQLAAAYKTADAATRNRIETGAVEHALETPSLRPFFAAWADDPLLRAMHERALEWGHAHTGRRQDR